MGSFPLDGFDGYTAKTLTFKSTPDGPISVDVVYPEQTDGSPSTVLIHYHGGFLVFGDRYSFLPYWLVHAAVSRRWIFVTPEYRLIPESTAHESVDDAVDAYKWVQSSLSGLLGRPIGSVLVSGSSAGGYLALQTGALAEKKPEALLLVYGMLDPAGSRYTNPGPNIFKLPAIEPGPVLHAFPKSDGKDETRKRISAYAMPPPTPDDVRQSLVFALHLEGLFADYATGVDGIGRRINEEGVEAIPAEHRRLFPLSFGSLADLPRTMLLHGVNDSAVPVECSQKATEKLRADGVEVIVEFPEDAEHGFDTQGNLNVNVESEGGDLDGINAVESLRRAIRFLDASIVKR